MISVIKYYDSTANVEYSYSTSLSFRTTAIDSEIQKWCEENLQDYKWTYNSISYYRYFFTTKRDKLLFDLTWG